MCKGFANTTGGEGIRLFVNFELFLILMALHLPKKYETGSESARVGAVVLMVIQETEVQNGYGILE